MPEGAEGRPLVAMLLDNHYGPDPRVRLETRLLINAGFRVRVIAWDRREHACDERLEVDEMEVVRLAVPAPPRGGRRTIVKAIIFGLRIFRERRRLLSEAAVFVVHDLYLLPVSYLLSRVLRRRFIYDAHEDFAAMEATRFPRTVLRASTAIESRLSRAAAAIIVPGESRVPRWLAAGFSRPVVLRNIRRDVSSLVAREPAWDVLYAGTLAPVRRLDLLVEVARARPDLRVAIAGRGAAESDIARAAAELPNIDYLGWRPDGDELAARARVLYYGLDPNHPYSEEACPNTLYEALRQRVPLIFFCGGEPSELLSRYRIGERVAPNAAALAAAVERACERNDWQFNEALDSLAPEKAEREYVDAVRRAIQ